ncbi:MAG: GyrI-like domain-containing protein [Enterococcus sp.]
MTEKYEWRKQEVQYQTKQQPQLLTLPKQNYFSIEGIGDPNQADFKARVRTLYPLSYAIRMSQKSGWEIPGYYPYTVYPLEGEWSLQARYLDEPVMKKEHFAYRLKIKQPDFVKQAIAKEALTKVKGKIAPELFPAIAFIQQPESLVGQILHIGPYEEEAQSFAILEAYLADYGYQRTSKEHTEIYLSDPRKSAPEKQKTILRVKVEKK